MVAAQATAPNPTNNLPIFFPTTHQEREKKNDQLVQKHVSTNCRISQRLMMIKCDPVEYPVFNGVRRHGQW